MEIDVQEELRRLRLELSLLKEVKPLVSPDSTVWIIQVDNLGVLTAIKK